MQSIRNGRLAAEAIASSLAKAYPEPEARGAALVGARDAIIAEAPLGEHRTEMIEALDRALGEAYRSWAPSGTVPSRFWAGERTPLEAWALDQYDRLCLLETEAASMSNLVEVAADALGVTDEVYTGAVITTERAVLQIEIENVRRLLGIANEVGQ